MASNGINGASQGRVYINNNGPASGNSEAKTAKFVTRRLKRQHPTITGEFKKIVAIIKNFLPKSLFSRKVELQKKPIFSQINRNRPTTIKTSNRESYAHNREVQQNVSAQKPLEDLVLIPPSSVYGDQNSGNSNLPVVSEDLQQNHPEKAVQAEQHNLSSQQEIKTQQQTVEENDYKDEEQTQLPEVNQQSHEKNKKTVGWDNVNIEYGKTYAHEGNVNGSKKTRIAENYDKNKLKAEFDMDVYKAIDAEITKIDFNRESLIGKSSKDVLKILRNHNLITGKVKNAIKDFYHECKDELNECGIKKNDLKLEDVDLDGSPYW